MDIMKIESSTITVLNIINREMDVIKSQTNLIKIMQGIEEMQIIEVKQETVEIHQERMVQIIIDRPAIGVDHITDHQGAEVAHIVEADHQDIGNNF